MRCLDTYALIEIEQENARFLKYTEQPFIITDLTLGEMFNRLLRKHNVATAEYWWKRLSPHTEPLSKELVREAVLFRFENRKANISFFDAAGYVFARSRKIPFVTGDKEFAGRPGVEFVK